MNDNPLMWAWFPGYENQYKISPEGSVWSFRRKGLVTNREVKTHVHRKTGYIQLNLRKDGDRKSRTYLIHRVVALAYLPNADDKMYINHINGNKTDNQVENLEWCTAKENMAHAQGSGLYDSRGERNWITKFADEDVRDIRMFASKGIKYKDIAKVYPVSDITISNIVRRKTWRHI